MQTLWTVIFIVAIANASIKAAGPVMFGGRQLPAPLFGAVSLFAPALLAGLIVTQVMSREGELVLDERVLGIGVAAVALVFRAPVLLAVGLAAATVAVVRLIA